MANDCNRSVEARVAVGSPEQTGRSELFLRVQIGNGLILCWEDTSEAADQLSSCALSLVATAAVRRKNLPQAEQTKNSA